MSPLINSVIYDVRLLNTEILNYKLLSLYSHKPTVVHLNTLILFFFTRYVVDLCWIYSVLLHDLIRGSFICCHTNYSRVKCVHSMTAGRTSPVALNQAQIITSPSSCLTVTMRCLCAVFAKYGAVHYDQTCPAWSELSRDLFFFCLDAIVQTLSMQSCHVLLRKKMVFPITLPNKSFFFVAS